MEQLEKWASTHYFLSHASLSLSERERSYESSTAFALYLDTTVSTSLLIAKTKVAPLNGGTIPQKELSGAQLLSKILVTAANTLSIPLQDVYA